MMNHLDDDLRQALQGYDSPPAGAQARNLAALQARLGGPAGPPDGEPGGHPGRPGLSPRAGALWAAKTVGATLGLAAAGLLALRLGAQALDDGRASSPDPPRVGARAASADADAAGEGDRRRSAAPPASAATGPPPTPTAEAAETAARPRASQPDPAEPTPAADASTLEAELVLISAAKRELGGAPQAALARLDEHAATFPAGLLAPERDGLRVEVACALGRDGDARRARAAFTLAHPSSPLRERFEAACRAAGVDLEHGDAPRP